MQGVKEQYGLTAGALGASLVSLNTNKSQGLSDAPWLNRRRPGSLYSIVEYEKFHLSIPRNSSCSCN
jgi:hypothetical protein